MEEETADEMFEKLGYEIRKTTNTTSYKLYDPDDILSIRISINNKTKRINIDCISEAIDLGELQAINKKVEEMGWNNE